jgi:hypothetical protein
MRQTALLVIELALTRSAAAFGLFRRGASPCR